MSALKKKKNFTTSYYEKEKKLGSVKREKVREEKQEVEQMSLFDVFEILN
jgi:hypothetical protein